MNRTRLALVMAVALVVAGDLLAWGGHVVWRGSALERLEPVVEQLDALEAQIREDDAWIATRTDLMQEYGQPDRYAARLQARGRRAAAHRALVDTYNEQLASIYRRFYLAPVPAPDPPFRTHLDG